MNKKSGMARIYNCFISEFKTDLLAEKLLRLKLTEKLQTRREIVHEKLRIFEQLQRSVLMKERDQHFMSGELFCYLSFTSEASAASFTK